MNLCFLATSTAVPEGHFEGTLNQWKGQMLSFPNIHFACNGRSEPILQSSLVLKIGGPAAQMHVLWVKNWFP